MFWLIFLVGHKLETGVAGPYFQTPCKHLCFLTRQTGQCTGGRQQHQSAALPHHSRGCNNTILHFGAQPHWRRGKGERSYDKAHSERNRIHKGRGLWSKANYFHRCCFCEEQWPQYDWSQGPAKMCDLGPGHYLLWPLSSVAKLCDLSQFRFLDGQRPPWRDTQMLGVKDGKLKWLGKPWKANANCMLFSFSV